ncbi:MAG: tripartite tricarboxylate transporter TctB family protein [Betaproteobacteria bacterium]|nr:tripartite tricarboxylate transporter TctB family protein [Betaproteobacteria bacterium]
MSIKSQKDFVSGLMFTVTGAAFAWNSAMSYDIGSASQMGPGFFPMALGLVLVMLGGFIMFFSLVVETPDGGAIGEVAWRPLVCILGANLLFGALLGGIPGAGLPAFGLVVAVYALTAVALLADGSSFTFRRVLELGSIMAAGSYLVFITLLHLPMPVWPAFVSGF